MTPEAQALVERLEMLAAKATPPGLNMCAHLRDPAIDQSCGCGYRGGVWTSDQEHILFTMGEPVSEQFPGLEAPRIDRAAEIASAHLLVELYDNLPVIIDALRALSLIEATHGEGTANGRG